MTAVTPDLAPAPKRPSWVRRHKILTALGVLVVLAAIGSQAGGGASPTSTTTTDTSTAVSSTAPSAAAPTPKKPTMTLSQQNAIGAAENYLQTAPFSRTGLIGQLSSKAGDGFSRADATFAVNHLHADWNAQAVKAAKNYLSISSFSRAGLIQQLSSSAGDAYTHAQAVYAANKVGLR